MNQTNTVDTEEFRRLEADIRRRTAAGIDPSPSEARVLLTALEAARAEVERLTQGCRLTAAACDQAREQRDALGAELETARAEVVRERRRTWEAWRLAHWWHTEEATSCRLAKERREEMKAAQAEAARERRGREVAEARLEYALVDREVAYAAGAPGAHSPRSPDGHRLAKERARLGAAEARLKALGAEVGR
jgi:hypothetical protein